MQVLMKKGHAMVVPSSAAAQENEVKSMNRSATGVMTGLAVGLAAGTAMYAATNMTTVRQRRKMKKAAITAPETTLPANAVASVCSASRFFFCPRSLAISLPAPIPHV